jgi:hypothetical protein
MNHQDTKDTKKTFFSPRRKAAALRTARRRGSDGYSVRLPMTPCPQEEGVRRSRTSGARAPGRMSLGGCDARQRVRSRREHPDSCPTSPVPQGFLCVPLCPLCTLW